jgi:hypothetical protein
MPIGDYRLRQGLEKLEPTEIKPDIRFYPCAARLDDGTFVKCVYFVTSDTLKRLVGYERPTDVPGLLSVSQERISSISESSARLPARFANRIYAGGETRMGCYSFSLLFSRWRRRGYLVGGFIDFLEFPKGYGPADVKDVVLHRGAEMPSPMPAYRWCVYGGQSDC